MATITKHFPIVKKRGPLSSTPAAKSQNGSQSKTRLDLSSWGLYPSVLQWFQERGVNEMFQWQFDCLSLPGVLDESHKKNLVFKAPTSAGKTLIGDLILLKHVFQSKKKVIIILPFVAIVSERLVALKSMLEDTHIKVGGFTGNFMTPGGFDAVDVAITTVEKANNYFLRLLEKDQLDDIGMIIVDEIHLINDRSRGYRLELLLTKVLRVCEQKDFKIQVIGMSADIPNLDDLSKWLDAAKYEATERPVKLQEILALQREDGFYDFFDKNNDKPLVGKNFHKVRDPVLHFASQILKRRPQDGQVPDSMLIFWNNKSGLEKLAVDVAKSVKPEDIAIERHDLEYVIDQLEKCSIPVDPTLRFVVKQGVGYHHADLATDHRDIIEDAFRNRRIRVLVSTSTLSSGVNLPASRVIVKSPLFRRGMMDIMQYRQMIGRAGRLGFHEKGMSMLVCSRDEVDEGRKLFEAEAPPISSSLLLSVLNSETETSFEKEFLLRSVMEAVATGIASNIDEVNSFLEKTFYAAQASEAQKEALIQETDRALKFLLKLGLLMATEEEIEKQILPEKLEATSVMTGLVSSSMDPNAGIAKVQEIQENLGKFVVGGDLPMIYFLLRDNNVEYLKLSAEKLRDWLIEWSNQSQMQGRKKTFVIGKTPDPRHQVSQMIGLHPGLIKRNSDHIQDNTQKKFYLALALHEIIREHPLHEVSSKYGIPKGVLQKLQQQASSLANMIGTLCDYCGWKEFKILFDNLLSRLEFGVDSVLIPLMMIPSMNVKLARCLFKAGIFKPSLLLVQDPEILTKTIKSLFKTNRVIEIKNKETQERSLKTQNQVVDLLLNESKELLEEELAPVLKIFSQSHESRQRRPSRRLPSVFDSPEKSPMRTQAINVAISSGDAVDSVTFDCSLRSRLTESTIDDLEESSIPVVKNPDDKSMADNKRKFDITYLMEPNKKAKSSSELQEYVKYVGDSIQPDMELETKLVESSEDIEEMFSLWSFWGIASMFIIPETEGIMMCFGDIMVYFLEGEIIQKEFGRIFNEHFKARLRKFALIVYDSNPVFIKLYKSLGVKRKILFETINWIDLKHRRWIKSLEEKEFEDEVTKEKMKKFPYPFPSLTKDISYLVKVVLGETKYRGFLSLIQNKDEVYRFSIFTGLLFPLWKGLPLDEEPLLIVKSLETPASLVFAELQSSGILVDRVKFKELQTIIDSAFKELDVLAKELTKDVGGVSVTMNLHEIESVRDYIYEYLNLTSKVTSSDEMKPGRGEQLRPVNKIRLTIFGKYHQLPRVVMDWRKLSYALDFMNQIQDALKDSKDNRIYGQVDTWTVTGRIAMSDPPLMLTPRNFSVTTGVESLGESAAKLDIRVRSIFVPRDGFIFLSSDFSQIELRILAHFSADEFLLSILNEGGDVFRLLAGHVFNKKPKDISDDERQRVKRFCYAIIYGMQSSPDFEEETKRDEDDAPDDPFGDEPELNQEEKQDFDWFRKTFLSTFPGIEKFKKAVEEDFEKNGYVETICGRKRYLPIKHEKQAAHVKRQAVNTKIQGSAADLMKLAMIHLHKKMRDKGLMNRVSLVHTMHDELIFEVHHLILEDFARLVKTEMSSVGQMFQEPFTVKLPVNLKTGSDWSDLKDFQL